MSIQLPLQSQKKDGSLAGFPWSSRWTQLYSTGLGLTWPSGQILTSRSTGNRNSSLPFRFLWAQQCLPWGLAHMLMSLFLAILWHWLLICILSYFLICILNCSQNSVWQLKYLNPNEHRQSELQTRGCLCVNLLSFSCRHKKPKIINLQKETVYGSSGNDFW